MSRSRATLRLLSCALVLASAAACVADDPPGSSPGSVGPASTATPGAPPAPDPFERLRPVWTRALDALTQPRVLGDVAIVLERVRGAELDIVGLGLADGQERWRHPYTPGRVPTGFDLEVSTASTQAGRELVVFQSPGTGEKLSWRAPIVAVSPATGRIVRRSDPQTVLAPLDECDSGHDVCTIVDYPSAQVRMRFDLMSADLVVDTVSSAATSRPIGPSGLYGGSVGGVESIGRNRGTTSVWQKPVAKLFGEGYTANAGWSFDLDEPSGTYHGYLGWLPPDFNGTSFSFSGTTGMRTSLDIRRIIGFSADEGRRRWVLERAIPIDSCLPDDARDDSLTVACYFRGDVRVEREQKAQPARGDEMSERWLVDDAGLIGFDPATGRVTWRVSGGRIDLLAFLPGNVLDNALSARHEVRLPGPRGPLVVDLRDGSSVRASRDTVAFCQLGDRVIAYALDVGSSFDTRYGDPLRRPCDGDGRPVRRPTRAAVEQAGVLGPDGLRVLSTRGGLVAYDVTPS